MKKTILIIAAIFVILFIIGVATTETDETVSTEKQEEKKNEEIETNKFGAFNASQEFIKQTLKAPGTAKFAKSWDEDVKMIYEPGTGNYITYIWVDAQNSYGALLRNNFKVTLKLSDDKQQWKLIDIVQL
jgi:hypothetical protein